MDNETNRIASQLLRATLSKLDAERQEALAVLDVYLHRSVGVADHEGVVDNLVEKVKNLATAEGAIEALQRHFLSDPDEQQASAAENE